ncbi:MAG: hypothetical protein HOF44_06120 [Pelagibacterales bacterium]|jgi:hypothetical protein|nr:hypothetical protein [Pelagibacterales bacterium]
MQPDNKSRTGFIRAMAREMLVHNTGVSVAEAIETSRQLYDKTYNLTYTHTGEEKYGKAIRS